MDNDVKKFTYVGNKNNKKACGNLCSMLPAAFEIVESVEELFPLLSDPNYSTDYIYIGIEVFHQRNDQLDMFDIINTLSTLIKSTVCRSHGSNRPKKRDTLIGVAVDEHTSPKLVREILQFPQISMVGWMLNDANDAASVMEHAKNIMNGDYSPHPKVLEILKKKKPTEKKDAITLTVRQGQVLNLIQARGASNKVIAKLLGISESTVKLHMGAILKKYGAKNRTQLAVFSKEKEQN